MMQREIGSKDYPIWLLGDSNPERWQEALKTPLDSRHPIRHNIWTSVLDVIQDRVFREQQIRVDTSLLYIRNAVDNPNLKPISTSFEWSNTTEKEIDIFRDLIKKHNPKMILSFGAFAFEFARRVLNQGPKRNFGYWGAMRLGEEFRHRITDFDPAAINALPLLHRSVAGGKFIQSHNYYCLQDGENYFDYVGIQIGDKLLEHQNVMDIWVKHK